MYLKMHQNITLCHKKKEINPQTLFTHSILTVAILNTLLPSKVRNQCHLQFMTRGFSVQYYDFSIVKFIKSQRLRWAAHVMRMEKTRTTRKITEWTPYKARPVGRPRLRWMDQAEEDLKRMKITGWRMKAEERQEWSRIVEQTKTHPGL